MDLLVVGFVFQNHPLLGTGTALCAQLDSVTGGSRTWAIFKDYMVEIYDFFFENVMVLVILQSPACLRKAGMIP